MSIKAYVGRMGSGKSYEVVSTVILGALRRGRRVVSNIAGLNYDAMREMLLAEGLPEAQIGELVQVEHEAVLLPTFWRTDKDSELEIDATIKPGDLLALDEVWRFWSGFAARGDDGSKRPDRVMNFFRMHRHFTHPETGIACDVALITQDVMDISRQVRAVIEETYQMEKHTAIGSTKRYRVDVHQGGKITRKPLRQLQRSYDPAFFPLYSSHSQKKEGDASAREENIDGRGNIFQGALFKFLIPAMVVFIAVGIWIVYGFFNPKPKTVKPEVAQASASADSSVSQAKQSDKKPLDVSDTWRFVGWYSSASGAAVVLEDSSKRVRVLYDAPALKIQGLQMSVVLPEGGIATSYSGVVASSSPIGKL